MIIIATLLGYSLLFLGVIIGNVLLGTYANLNEGNPFSLKKMLNGLLKGLLIAVSTLITALVYDQVNITAGISNIELSPNNLMITGILFYLYKNYENLKKILNIQIGTSTSDTNEVGDNN